MQVRTFKYLGHVVHNEPSVERLVVQGQVQGKRSLGHSPTHWTDIITAKTQTFVVQKSRDAIERNKGRDIGGASLANDNAASSTTIIVT